MKRSCQVSLRCAIALMILASLVLGLNVMEGTGALLFDENRGLPRNTDPLIREYYGWPFVCFGVSIIDRVVVESRWYPHGIILNCVLLILGLALVRRWRSTVARPPPSPASPKTDAMGGAPNDRKEP